MDVIAVDRNNFHWRENLEIRVPFGHFFFILFNLLVHLQEVKDRKWELVSISFSIQFKIRIQIYILWQLFSEFYNFQ